MKIKVFLHGKHSNRTPLSYRSYIKLFEKHIIYTSNPHDADLIVTGFNIDFLNSEEAIDFSSSKAKLVVLSEEPLWDTVWSGDYLSPTTTRSIGKDKTIQIHNVNHFTSNVYSFAKIPYFITTEDSYFIRYNMLFIENTKLSASNVKSIMNNARYKFAFMAAKRTAKELDVKSTDGKLIGLSKFRSEITELLLTKAEAIFNEGHGWPQTLIRRQQLVDWHLDKLATLNRQSKVISAIENTYHPNYISEKIFDAFALLSCPIYYADQNHSIHRIANMGSFLNIHSLSSESAASKINQFDTSPSFLEAYQETQNTLCNLFNNLEHLHTERERVTSAVLHSFNEILEGKS